MIMGEGVGDCWSRKLESLRSLSKKYPLNGTCSKTSIFFRCCLICLAAKQKEIQANLLGGIKPFEKYACQIGSFY